MGLKLLKEELLHIGNAECMAIINDTQESCFVAIEILNDMLTYDKMKSGLLTLEKKKISPASFIESVVTPFNAQVFPKFS